MTRIALAPEVLDDFERFLDHMARFDIAEASGRIEEITRAIDVLAAHPLVGRPVRGGKRELVIGRDARGYIALYRYVARIDTVFVLAIRHQHERRYKRGSTPRPRS